MSKPRVVLVHHHIFKNAGTSFNYALKQSFGKNFFEYDLPDSRVVTVDDLTSFIDKHQSAVAISGHHIAMPPISSEHIKTISSVIIRDPISRVRSIYNFERKQDAQTDGAVMAKQLSFKDFVAWRLENSPHVFCDYQTLYCSRTGGKKESDVLLGDPLELAIKNLQNCFAVGTVARYREFLMMAQYEAARYFPNIVFRNAHLNVTSKNKENNKGRDIRRRSLEEDLGSALVDKLKQMNRLDNQLYEFTNNRLERWLQTDRAKKAQYFESLGKSLVEQKDWRSARPVFQSALSIADDSRFKTYYGLAECLERTGDIDGAIAYYRQTIEKKPDFAWSYFRLGDIFHNQEAFSESLEYYKKAISVHPVEKSFFLYVSLGDTLAKLGEVDAAAEAYLQADEIDSSALISKAKLAWIHTVRDQPTQSAKYVERMMHVAPDECTAYVELGNVFLTHENPHMAIEFYRKGVKADPHSKICSDKLRKAMNALVPV